MSIVFDNEMMKALDADGEKIRALTGEDHGPYFAYDVASIPADILMAADEAYLKANSFVGWDDGVACIAEAILAEQARCLRAIDDYATAHGARHEHDDDGLHVELVCQEVGGLIRGTA